MSELTDERLKEIRCNVNGSQWAIYKREWFMQAIFDLLGGIDQLRADLAAANERERLMLEIPANSMSPLLEGQAGARIDAEHFVKYGNQMRDKYRAILTDAGKGNT